MKKTNPWQFGQSMQIGFGIYLTKSRKQLRLLHDPFAITGNTDPSGFTFLDAVRVAPLRRAPDVYVEIGLAAMNHSGLHL